MSTDTELKKPLRVGTLNYHDVTTFAWEMESVALQVMTQTGNLSVCTRCVAVCLYDHCSDSWGTGSEGHGLLSCG